MLSADDIDRANCAIAVKLEAKRAGKRKPKAAIPKPPSLGEETFALQCRAYGLAPVREYKFHPDRKWKADFAFPQHRLLVEIEGGTEGRSRHRSDEGYEGDCLKYNAAALLGWHVLRYTTQIAKSAVAIDQVRAFIGKRKGDIVA